MEWYDNENGVFSKEYIDNFAPILDDTETYEQIEFVDNYLNISHNSDRKILDLCCGHGRHSINLFFKGYKVTGIDLSSYFIDVAMANAKKKQANIQFIRGDMRKIPFIDEFDAVLSMCTSFGYFEHEYENEQVVKSVHQCLKNNGKFLLDIDNRERTIKYFKEHEWFENKNSTVVLRKATIDLEKSRNIEDCILIDVNGKRINFKVSIRMFTIKEIFSLLTRNNFIIESVYGDYDGSSYCIDSSRMIVISKKKGGDQI